MSATQITVTYISAPPSTTSTVTLPIVSAGGGQADYSMTVLNLVRSRGFWFTDVNGLLTFIPLLQIVKITAQ
jgi:hypothetical protein